MKTIDPQAQILVDQFHELAKNLSAKAKKWEPSDEDMKIFEQLQEVSTNLSAYDIGSLHAAIISVNAYGYNIGISINGKDLGRTGSGSESSRFSHSINFHKTPPN